MFSAHGLHGGHEPVRSWGLGSAGAQKAVTSLGCSGDAAGLLCQAELAPKIVSERVAQSNHRFLQGRAWMKFLGKGPQESQDV